MTNLLAGSAAICASAMLLGGSPVAQSVPPAVCGPDQATAVDVVRAHEPHEVLTGRPFSPIPVGGNFDPCADLSAILLTVDPPFPGAPVQAMLFQPWELHRTSKSHAAHGHAARSCSIHQGHRGGRLLSRPKLHHVRGQQTSSHPVPLGRRASRDARPAATGSAPVGRSAAAASAGAVLAICARNSEQFAPRVHGMVGY